MENFYELLGVETDADLEEIQDAYEYKKKSLQRKLAKAEGNEAEEERIAGQLRQIFKANKTLSNEADRDAYDEENGLGRYARAAKRRYVEEEEEETPAPKKQPIGFQAEPVRKPAARSYDEEEAPVRKPVAKHNEEEEEEIPVRKAAAKKPAYAEEDLPALGQAAFKKKRRKEIAAKPLWIAVGNGQPIYLEPKMANRHGLIAGATGTGKTVTLKVLAEHFSNIGVPVFLADIKGDVWTMCEAGENSAGFTGRLKKKLGFNEEIMESLGIDPEGSNDAAKNSFFKGCPIRFWDVYGEKGHPVRTTVSQMGPELLSRLLELNETQSGVMNIIFRYADDNGLLILDMKDLRTMVKYCADNADELKATYGNISAPSVGAIQRALLKLEDAGGDIFFGEPALDLNDWFEYDENGRGVINLLHCAKLFQKPILYSTFLLWMLSGLYDMLPEKGDADKPEMVFFFDEAHLIFKDAPKSLLSKVEQIVRLIRSKGVGVYFISQLPADIPDSVLSQLGNKIQHALRAYTPKDQAAVKSAAASFRANPKVKAEQALTELGTGEALISMMDSDGKPAMVERAWIMPPHSYLGSMEEEVRQEMIADDTKFSAKYKDVFDRISAYEILSGKIEESINREKLAQAAKDEEKRRKEEEKEQARIAREERAAQREADRQEDREYKRQQQEEDREYKRRVQEEERQRKQEEREYARKLKEEEAQRKAEERAEALRMKQEEAERRAEERAEALRMKQEEAERKAAERRNQQLLNAGIKALGGSSGMGKIARGIFGSLFK